MREHTISLSDGLKSGLLGAFIRARGLAKRAGAPKTRGGPSHDLMSRGTEIAFHVHGRQHAEFRRRQPAMGDNPGECEPWTGHDRFLAPGQRR